MKISGGCASIPSGNNQGSRRTDGFLPFTFHVPQKTRRTILPVYNRKHYQSEQSHAVQLRTQSKPGRISQAQQRILKIPNMIQSA
mmetsp:Transcript_23059/g.92270  ORF Transcript_23059/g.92270 Transcript_23059/m.92270 type:complete len:85 (-) Transcript_23059:209-463(-)